MINCHQNEKNGQRGHKTALNSQFFPIEKGCNQLNLHSVVSSILINYELTDNYTY